ncbi:stage III sporulation protein AF [Radiobacillus kanasensis]|uniref:stage III sporulation protein AF n=1 Tax=Radiobacillus kanasensis TaxID=2844358 RepID=UPI001E4D1F74|nr:stage III sporulation protein AF [Radiobacillus kanasensis]UFT97737.1 stage III sporulation protein AF [Radiobacillus kanasensis]
MQYIMDWVTQIILFLLIAMVIDLLLPNSSMRKYIRVVVGLLLILIFLKPVFHLFEIDTNQLLSEVMPTMDTSIEEENMKNSIELKKNEIQASQRAYILDKMAVQMENSVEEELKKDYGVAISEIKLVMDEEASELNQETLKQVEVKLTEQDSASTGQQESIEEVVIDFGEKEEHPSERAELPSEDIKNFLTEKWELQESKLILSREGGV